MNADAKDSQRTLLDPDEVVRGTNDDALACKHSAVAAGYLADPFIKAFLKRSPRKAPVINRGTYSRTAALDMLVTKFLTSSAQTTHIHTTQLSKSALQTVANKQIISLGAGSDTRYLLLKAAGLNPHRYIEIDYPQVTAKKAQALMKDKDTRQMIDLDHGQVFGGGTGITTDSYWLIPGDLREFASVLMPKLISMGLDTGIPTLILSECVFVYLDPGVSTSILECISASFTTVMVAVYEQIHPDDAFGLTMIHNLKARNITLPGIYAYPTLASQVDRYLDCGWTVSKAIDLNTVWDKYIVESEKQRVAKLEVFDEIEEWRLLSQHYCIAWAAKSVSDLSNAEGLGNALVDAWWF